MPTAIYLRDANYYFSRIPLKIDESLISEYFRHLTLAFKKARWPISTMIEDIWLGHKVLALKLHDEHGKPLALLSIQPVEDNINVWLIPYSKRLKTQHFKNIVRMVELQTLIFLRTQQMNNFNLYLVFPKHPEAYKRPAPRRRSRVIERIFHDTMVYLFILSILVAYLFYVVFKQYIIIALPAFEIFILLFADKILGVFADWRITVKDNIVYLAHCIMPQYKQYEIRKLLKDVTLIKKEIYDRTIKLGKDVGKEVVEDVLKKHGYMSCKVVEVKKFNIYRLVRDVANRLGLPTPKIVLANTVIPNAAASGIGAFSSIVLITSGLLAMLNEDEIKAVLGHELSHIRNRDPLALFLVSTFEYIIRLTLLASLFLSIPLFWFFYFIAITYILLFIAKMLEARADLEAAIFLRAPEKLAYALKKIGLRRLILERYPALLKVSWLNFDPHPPVSWRIIRLEELEDYPAENPQVLSIKECIRGLFGS